MSTSKQVDKALRHIEAHLKDELRLEDVADAANYSPWHFHRLFSACTGSTLGDYIRKRRLSEASKELVSGDRPIKQIAADYRFESQSAFTRSFKQLLGCTPGKMRAGCFPAFRFDPLEPKQRGETMQKPKIIHNPGMRVFGISCRSTVNNNVIPALWERFNQVCAGIPGSVKPGIAYGICYSDPGVEMTADTPFSYLAAIEVAPDAARPDGIEEMTLPAVDYAVFEHRGSLDTLQETIRALYGEWLPASGLKWTGKFDLEYYGPAFSYGQEDSSLELWIPVVKA